MPPAPPNAPEPGLFDALSARLRAEGRAFSDAVFGTRTTTVGAVLQRPRKAALRVEPKTYFANERTFLAWLSMAVSLGGVSTALVGFTAEEKPDSASKHPGVLRRKTVDLISVLLLPVSIAMIGYALFIFLCRSRSIRTKQVGFFTDWLGPAVLAGVLLLVLLTITVAAFASVIAG